MVIGAAYLVLVLGQAIPAPAGGHSREVARAYLKSISFASEAAPS